MKIKSLIVAFLPIVVFASCIKFSDIGTFTIADQTTIQVGTTTLINAPFEVPTPDITTNSSQEFENNNTNADLVKDIKLEDLKLSITNPSGKSFSFLKSVHLYISTAETDEIELAYIDDVPVAATTIFLITSQEKLDSYIKAPSYKIRSRIETRETVTQTIDMQVDFKFKVTASLR